MPPGEVIARGEKPLRMGSRTSADVQPAQLIGFAHSIDGMAINYDTRLVLVYELNTAITAIREKHGPPPIDDGLPG
jgi:hypothetical protein